VRARRLPTQVGVGHLVGEPGVVRAGGYVLVSGELWHARARDDRPLVPGETVRVERVEEDGLELVVGSSEPTEGS